MSHDSLTTLLILHPRRGVTQAVVSGKWKIPLVFLILAVTFSGAAFAWKWNAEPSVLRMMSATGALTKSSEREVFDRIQTAERSRRVSELLHGLVGVPTKLLLGALALSFLFWLWGEKVPFLQAFTSLTVALLPVALFHLIYGVSALRQIEITEASRDFLVPSHLGVWLPSKPVWLTRLGRAFDLFRLWSVIWLGFGLSAENVTLNKKAMRLTFVFYFMYVGVFELGLPGIMGGQP